MPDLLKRFRAFETADAGAFEHALRSKFGATRASVETSAGFRSRASSIEFHEAALILGVSNTGVSIDFPGSDHYRFMVARTGGGTVIAGGRAIELDEQQSCIVSCHESELCRARGSHSWLTLRINSSAVERKLISLLGWKPKGKLEFNPAVKRDNPRIQGLVRLILHFAEQLDSTSTELPPLLVHELEQALTVGFLCANRHTFSELLEPKVNDTAPHHVRRAEEYIEANWSTPISIEDLVTVTGVSARGLFRSFMQARGYTPMAFARLVRLKHARELLSAGTPDVSVTGVAFQCGFANLGHFADNYRRSFGELPSDTLTRTR